MYGSSCAGVSDIARAGHVASATTSQRVTPRRRDMARGDISSAFRNEGCRKRLSFEARAAGVECQSAACEPADRLRVDAMFLDQHALREAPLVVTRQNRDTCLYDHRTAIEFGRHEMHTCP